MTLYFEDGRATACHRWPCQLGTRTHNCQALSRSAASRTRSAPTPEAAPRGVTAPRRAPPAFGITARPSASLARSFPPKVALSLHLIEPIATGVLPRVDPTRSYSCSPRRSHQPPTDSIESNGGSRCGRRRSPSSATPDSIALPLQVLQPFEKAV